MTVTIETGDPRDPAATALLKSSHALMQELFPAESNHYLSIDDLCAPNIRFFISRTGNEIKGCGAIAVLDGYGEIKSMFTAPDARGLGVAAKILTKIEEIARAENLPVLRLETGDLLHDAHRLYARMGFTKCGPFRDYVDGPHSVFMEKRLS